MPSHLHLLIFPPDKLQLTPGIPSHQVSRPVHPRPSSPTECIRHKLLRRPSPLLYIPPPHSPPPPLHFPPYPHQPPPFQADPSQTNPDHHRSPYPPLHRPVPLFVYLMPTAECRPLPRPIHMQQFPRSIPLSH